MYALERKLELVEGKYWVSKSERGAKVLCKHILDGYGPRIALELCPDAPWLEALGVPQGTGPQCTDLLGWANAQPGPSELNLYIAGEVTVGESVWRGRLMADLWGICKRLGDVGMFSGGFLMRAGEHVFQPDFWLYSGESRVHDYYTEGAEVVIEILNPNTRAHDEGQRRDWYARAGISEYWLVDCDARVITFLRLEQGQYSQQYAVDGVYIPSSLPQLACFPANFWTDEYDFIDLPAFGPADPSRPTQEDRSRWQEGKFWPYTGPFRVGLDPIPITLKEFLTWTQEPKFEMFEGRIWVGGGGRETTQEVLRLLMMTLGLREVVKLLSARAWVEEWLEGGVR